MGAVQALKDRLRRLVRSRRLGESDAPADLGRAARTRATGGVPDATASNPNATTGTTPSETFVGRAGADETLGAEVTGAEARAGETADGAGKGAARNG